MKIVNVNGRDEGGGRGLGIGESSVQSEMGEGEGTLLKLVSNFY